MTTALAWPAIASSDHITPSTGYSSWPVRWLWYMTLTFSLTAAAAAMQLAIFLHRLSTYPDGLEKIQNLLGEQIGMIALTNPPNYMIRKFQLVTWQIPMMLLNGSVHTFLVGLVWLIVDGADFHRGWGSRDTKVGGLNPSTISLRLITRRYLPCLFLERPSALLAISLQILALMAGYARFECIV